jgi:hypothetical protein
MLRTIAMAPKHEACGRPSGTGAHALGVAASRGAERDGDDAEDEPRRSG